MIINVAVLAFIASVTAVALWASGRYHRELLRVTHNRAHTQALLHDGFLGHLLRNAPLYLGTLLGLLMGFALGWQAYTQFTAG